ncbi:anillin, actin binding protein 2 isoform X2 [Labrus mixtus]|uniref:anillin, actin binding protein 2 isoform X2 n=1 Tax=Labrus mixtus TaxID=508554 RepID=UPI0029C0C0AA|nr:anillin, actin binding protein 2 isoform X2 [Labrus mixtus]
MEAAKENSGKTNMKRQRTPLSDSEDNVFISSEESDGQKRRRLEAAGQENRSPKHSSSGRLLELETKPDTPMVPSVRSRVHLLTQRQDGVAPLAQRCLSDPGAFSPSVMIQEKAFREHLLDEGEFTQRKERFKAPLFQASPAPTPSSANPCPKSCSNFVSDIQQKLQGTTTPSSKQAVRMRQERELELNQLHFQPISENAWLKRSSSDPTLTQGRTPTTPTYTSCWVPGSVRGVRWPPMKPWDASGDAENEDGSFTETTTLSGNKQSSVGTGERPCWDSEALAASGEPENSNQLLKIQQKDQSNHEGEEVEEEIDKASVGGEEKLRPPTSQTVLKLSFSEDQGLSNTPLSEEQNVSELPTRDDQSFRECSYSEESNMKETGDISRENETGRSEANSFDCSSHNDEVMEISMEEEFSSWRYPLDGKEEESILAEQEGDLKSSRVQKDKGGSAPDRSEHSDTEHGECDSSKVSAEVADSSEMTEIENVEGDILWSESCSDDQSKENVESCNGFYDGAGQEDIFTIDKSDTEVSTRKEDVSQQSKEIQTIAVKEEDMDLEADRTDLGRKVKHTLADKCQAVTVRKRNTKYVSKLELETKVESSDTDGSDGARSLTEAEASEILLETEELEQAVVDDRQSDVEEAPKKVSFILEPELINDSTWCETNAESRVETSLSDAELSSHDETNTAEIIDQMFEEVLEYAERIEEERVHHEDTEGHDSGIGACSVENIKMDTESKKDKSEEEGEAKEEDELDDSKMLEKEGDDMLTFPPSCILSPLSKSVEAVVTPLRLTVSEESNPPSLLLTPEEASTPPAESAPLYSIDAYRTQRQSKPSTIQSVTPGVQGRAPEKSRPQPSVSNKEKIKALNEEAGKLQTVISQTLQALSCCTDEEHGRGSLEEAEAEKLLLVSCEKRSALLVEMARLREERNLGSGEAAGKDKEYNSQQPCRGTVSISNIQLPLKVEFVCSSLNHTGSPASRPSHYFFILIRYGPCNIVATPLATAADAKNGDTISFPTSVTLKDIRSSFEIDVEVYSLSHTSGNNCTVDRTTTKSRVTPRKILNTITRSGNSLTTAALPALNTRRSSNFCLVGSHKVTLASLGHSKFPLDKMKLEGKIRRLLGDEFQEKVPFLSPLEGNIYLRLDSESHSSVQHQDFLTMFELISGYGVWHRRYFVLKGCDMSYWNHPNDRETKGAEGNISLSNFNNHCLRPVKRDSCARPFTFELVSNVPQQTQDNSQEALAKCWFSADTKQERLDWMEKLNQVLLDFHTWNRTPACQTQSQELNTSISGILRESIL